MSLSKIVKYIVTIAIIAMFVLTSVGSVLSFAQGAGILLEIPKVTKDGETEDVQKKGTGSWEFDGVLTLDDEIRYRWNNASLDLSYKSAPAFGGGYLKIYLEDDSSEENLVLEYGSSPLPVNLLGEKIPEGEVTLLFVYVDSMTGNTPTKTAFTFDFKNVTTKPNLKVVSPNPSVVLAQGVNHEFKIELRNFALTSSTKPEDGTGKLNIYYNNVSQETLIGTVNNSIVQEDGVQLIAFDSKNIEFDRIPDSEKVNLIFALTNVSGDVLEYRTQFPVKTNFNNSINLGLPKVTFIEPQKDRLDLSVDGNRKFVLQIDNFELLEDFESGAETDGKQGYLQILVDNQPKKTIWTKENFSLNEIAYLSGEEGQKEVTVQLVNPDFTKLVPEARDQVTVVYVPEETPEETGDVTASQGDSWRLVIIALVVLMIAGGITLLITKG